MFISKNEPSNPFILFLLQMWIGRKEHFRFVMYISAKKTYSSRSTLESGGEIRVERRWRENCVGKQYRCGKSSMMKMSKGGALQVRYERLDACAGSIIRRRRENCWREDLRWIGFGPYSRPTTIQQRQWAHPWAVHGCGSLTKHARWSK